MPQMNPTWWFSLFLIFVLTLVLTNSLNYFYSKISISTNMNKNIDKKTINWKW